MRFKIRVIGGDADITTKATVLAEISSGKWAPARLDSTNQLYGYNSYWLTCDAAIPFRLRVSSEGFEPQTVWVNNAPRGAQDEIMIWLGKKGDSYTYVGGFRRPCTLQPNRLGIAAPGGCSDSLKSLLKLLGLRVSSVDEGAFLIVERDTPFARFNEKVLRELRSSPLTSYCGPLIDFPYVGNNSPNILLNSISVRFRPGISDTARDRLLNKYGLNIRERTLDVYLLQADASVGAGILDIMESLASDKDVASVHDKEAPFATVENVGLDNGMAGEPETVAP